MTNKIKKISLFFFFTLLSYTLSLPFRSSAESQSFISSSQSEFAQAALSKQVLYYIGKNYHDTSRINPKQMLRAGLFAMSRSIPEILIEFPENASKISVTLGYEDKKFSLPPLKDSNDLDNIHSILKPIFEFIEKNYKGEIELSDIERNFISGMLENLDPHSALLPPKIFKEFKTQTEGEFGGLGIVIGLRDGELTVVSPIEGTPAWKAGIKAKDKIIKIGSEATINMNLNEAVEKLRGKIGSKISLVVLREGNAEPFEVTLTRAKIKIESVQSKLLSTPEGDFAYVKLKGFQEDTYRELVKGLEKVKGQAKNFKGLILDLRNNPGGLLNQAIEISDLFLNDGTIVSTIGAGNQIKDSEKARALGTEPNYPIAVLVNNGSASASEIVAGALKNNNRALIIGEQTFGKGSVQSVYTLRDTSALKLTIAQYLTPGNESIQSVGITPDIELVEAHIEANNTSLLQSDSFREKDLEKHLESSLNQNRKPSYQIRYFEAKKQNKKGKGEDPSDSEKEEPNDYSNTLQLNDDQFVGIAQKFILNAKNPSRPQWIKDSSELEKKIEQEQDEKIKTALTAFNIDWSKGYSQQKPKAEVNFQIENEGNSDTLKAGGEYLLKLRVKNVGAGDFYQLVAKTHSDSPYLKNKEFIFGKLKSGEEKSWSTKVKLPDSALSRQDELKFNFQEAFGNTPESFAVNLYTAPLPRPVYSYTYRFVNPEEQIKKGEKIKLQINVKNLGEGRSKDTLLNLKNLSGEGVFISQGRAKLGSLEPGETKENALEFSIDPSYAKESVELEVSIVDNRIQEFFSNKLKFNLKTNENQPPADSALSGPFIQLGETNLKQLSQNGKFEIRASANSNNNLKDITIYVNENKVFLKTIPQNQKEKKVSFQASVALEKESNLITIYVRDERDVSSYRSFYVRKKN